MLQVVVIQSIYTWFTCYKKSSYNMECMKCVYWCSLSIGHPVKMKNTVWWVRSFREVFQVEDTQSLYASIACQRRSFDSRGKEELLMALFYSPLSVYCSLKRNDGQDHSDFFKRRRTPQCVPYKNICAVRTLHRDSWYRFGPFHNWSHLHGPSKSNRGYRRVKDIWP